MGCIDFANIFLDKVLVFWDAVCLEAYDSAVQGALSLIVHMSTHISTIETCATPLYRTQRGRPVKLRLRHWDR